MKKIRYKSYSNNYLSVRNKPVNINTKDDLVFSKEYCKLIKSAGIYSFNEVGVTNEGLILEGFKLREESLIYPEAKKWFNIYWITLKKIVSKKNIIKSRAILTYNNWTEGYFHWMTETIPRLLIAKKYFNNNEIELLMPRSLYPIYDKKSAIKSLFIRETIFFKEKTFYYDSMAPFGFKKIHLIGKDIDYFDEVNLIEKQADSGNYNDEIMQDIRKIYLDYLSRHKNFNDNTGKYIYVSRKKATRRKIINELEVEILLKEFNFQTIYFEDFNFWEQVNIAKNAKILVAQHGAALTNMLFMNENTSVFEIKANNDMTNHCYFSLASSLGIKYYYKF